MDRKGLNAFESYAAIELNKEQLNKEQDDVMRAINRHPGKAQLQNLRLHHYFARA